MSNAVANPPKQTLTIRDHLCSPWIIEELKKSMPRHCSPERMARVALTALTKTPKLAQCEQASFFKCLLDLSQWGLEPDGRRAHLIPYGNQCTLIIDYKGYVELAYRSGVVKNIHADVVYAGDLFEYNLGRVEKHVPHFLRTDSHKPEGQGDVIAAYCIVELQGGTVKCELMSKEDVEKIRRRSKAGSNGPWVSDWNEMSKKTVFRRASKWLPLSAELRDAFDRDDDRLAEEVQPNGEVKTFDQIASLIAEGEQDAPPEGEPESSGQTKGKAKGQGKLLETGQTAQSAGV